MSDGRGTRPRPTGISQSKQGNKSSGEMADVLTRRKISDISRAGLAMVSVQNS